MDKRSSNMSIKAIIVTPPFSPFDAGPPAGPAVLKAHAAEAGIDIVTVDLNIVFLRQFNNGTVRSRIIGDHAKDDNRIRLARQFFRESICLPRVADNRIPSGLDPSFALPHNFSEIEEAVRSALSGEFWPRFFKQHLFTRFTQPCVLGVSLMGPAQVLPAILLGRLAKKIWPTTVLVAGGSHVTLKRYDIERIPAYGGCFDFYLPGHSEHIFCRVLGNSTALSRKHPEPGLLIAGETPTEVQELPWEAWQSPVFEQQELRLYPPDRMSLPVQFTRGCIYHRCRFCTYPAVEPMLLSDFQQTADRMLRSLVQYGCPRFSVKDSLLDIGRLKTLGKLVCTIDSNQTWSATTKIVPAMNALVMKELFAGGCRTLEFGVETIHPNLQRLLDKPQSIRMIDQVLEATLDAGIAVVINLIYGLPRESLDQARAQLRWFQSWKQRFPELVVGSHNLLEINEGSIFVSDPTKYGIRLGEIGPWAYSYPWNAPIWRLRFLDELRELT